MRERYEIKRSGLWVLRHHPDPAPLPGWMLLDTLRHCSGPVDFTTDEAVGWGIAVQQASDMVQQLTQCDRVYAIAFGEGAQHLHLHLIPRLVTESSTKAWAVADYYRSVESNHHPPATLHKLRHWFSKRVRTRLFWIESSTVVDQES